MLTALVLLALAQAQAPPGAASGEVVLVAIRHVASLRFGRMQLGTCTVKLVAEQGGRRVEQSASLEVVPVPTMTP